MQRGPTDVWDQWDRRLNIVRGRVLTLPRRTVVRPVVPELSLPSAGSLVLAAGTAVRYEETRYDSSRPDQAYHYLSVVSGPAAGQRVVLEDVVGSGPLAWET